MSGMSAFAERLRRDPGLALLLVALVAALAVYAQTFGYGLVNHDDPWLVRDNWIVQDASWSSIKRILFDLDIDTRATLGAEYLPVRDLSIMIDFAVWGDWFAGFHITNVAVYLASIALWFGALASFGVDRRIVGLAVLLWALHPSHAESVAWISERKGVLAMMFAGASALGYARFRAGRHARWLVLAAACAVLAIWSKSLAAFAIASFAGLEWILPGRQSVRRSLLGLGVISVVSIAAFVPILRVAVDLAVVAGGDGHRITNAVGLMGFYARLGLMTMPNAISYELATQGPSTIDLVVGTVTLAAAVALFFQRNRVLRAASLIWLVGWFPVSRLVLPVKAVVVADRYLLFPSLGLALALAVVVMAIPKRRTAIALVTVLVFASGIRTLAAQVSWRDKLALWENAVASNPYDGNAWSTYVEALASSGQHERALAEAKRGLAVAPAPRLQMQLGLLLLATDRVQARTLMQQAAEGGIPQAMTNLAVLIAEDGHPGDALPWARRAIEVMPRYALGFRVLGKIALANGRTDEAIAAFDRALGLEPTCTNQKNLATALRAANRNDEATRVLGSCR
jgi:protein O-mannosyl-transferase